MTRRPPTTTRLLDGYDREATIADFMPQLPPDADERARKAFAGACFRNGLKPPTVHVPGVREQKAEYDAGLAALERLRAQVEDRARRVTAFAKKVLVAALDFCDLADDAARLFEREGMDASGLRGIVKWFVDASNLDPDALDPDALDAETFRDTVQRARSEAREGVRARRRKQVAQRNARAQVTANYVPREVRTDWEPRKQSNDRGIER